MSNVLNAEDGQTPLASGVSGCFPTIQWAISASGAKVLTFVVLA